MKEETIIELFAQADMITRLRFQDGVLYFSFAQEEPIGEKRFTRWDELRVTLNRSVFPNLWKELSPQEKAKLLRNTSGTRKRTA